MNNSDKKILTYVAIGLAAGIAGIAVVALATRKDYSKYYVLQKFIVDPLELASPDQKDSWKKMDRSLMRKMEKLAEKRGKKLNVTSGARSTAYNVSVGGVRDSSHLIPKGQKAADIQATSSADALQMAKDAKSVGFKRIGVGRTFIHVDTDITKDCYPCVWGKGQYASSPYTKSFLQKELNLA